MPFSSPCIGAYDINIVYHWWFNLGHLVIVVSARFLPNEVTKFPSLLFICRKCITKSSTLLRWWERGQSIELHFIEGVSENLWTYVQTTTVFILWEILCGYLSTQSLLFYLLTLAFTYNFLSLSYLLHLLFSIFLKRIFVSPSSFIYLFSHSLRSVWTCGYLCYPWVRLCYYYYLFIF